MCRSKGPPGGESPSSTVGIMGNRDSQKQARSAGEALQEFAWPSHDGTTSFGWRHARTPGRRGWARMLPGAAVERDLALSFQPGTNHRPPVPLGADRLRLVKHCGPAKDVGSTWWFLEKLPWRFALAVCVLPASHVTTIDTATTSGGFSERHSCPILAPLT